MDHGAACVLPHTLHTHFEDALLYNPARIKLTQVVTAVGVQGSRQCRPPSHLTLPRDPRGLPGQCNFC